MRLALCLVVAIALSCALLGRERALPDSSNGFEQQDDRATDVQAPPKNHGIRITAPAGGERWVSGSVHRISWDASSLNMGPVKIGYRSVKTGTIIYFATVRGNVGTYKWSVKDKRGQLPPGEYQMVISGLASGHCTSSIPGHCQEGSSGASNPFTITAPSDSH